MIVSWMLYSLLVALLLAAAAGPLERVLRLYGRPGRWAWVAAVAGALLVPAVSLGLAGGGGDAVGASLGSVTPVAAPAATALEGVTRGLESSAAPILRRIEAPVLRLWAIASAALLLLFGASVVRLGRFRRGWAERVLDGEAVLVSREVGPAVLGLLRPRIVVPEWVVERGPEARRLIVQHEREHCRARDPLLVLLTALPVLLLPWNLPLWWCLARLRLAVEVDCDERVLRTATPGARRRYGRLLVEVGRRPSGPVRVLAAFSERPSALERRVRALSERLPEDRVRRAAGLGALGAVAVVAACVVPSPDAPESSLEPEVEEGFQVEIVPESPEFTPFTGAPEIRNGEEVVAALAREYPPLLRDAGIGGTVEIWLHVDETGRVTDTRINESSGHDGLDQAALEVAGIMRFSPAMNRDKAVPVWISLPVDFGVEAPEAEPPPEIEIPPSPGEVPRRTELPPPPEVEADLSEEPVFTPFTEPPSVTNRSEVQAALVEEYPPTLRDAGIGGTVNVWFYLTAEGRVGDVRVQQSSGYPPLDAAALRVARGMEFTPAMNRDRAVPVWISLPITFEVR